MNVNDLVAKAKWLRKEVFEMLARAGQGHLASAFSQIEIIVALYYGGVLRYQPGNPDDPERDRVLISKGHATMSVYPILADIGFFPMEELDRYGTPEGLLRIFGNITIPGIDVTSGSLGHGPGVGSGMCIAAKRDGSDRRCFVVLSEGEMYEGSTWESILFAAHNKLDNLIVVLDRNHKIILGDTEDMLGLDPIDEKWRACGWHVLSADGHSFDSLLEAFGQIGSAPGKPTVIIAETVKGKGISFMEGRPEWHYLIGDEE